MPDHPFEDAATHYAYSGIHNFFDVFGLEPALEYTDSLLQAATSPKVWKKEAPSNLLFYTEKLKGLCMAVFTINDSYAERKEAILADPENDVPDIFVTENFIDTYYFSTAWNNFPRHLTARQYHNPYRAIKKFCIHMAEPQWNKFLKEITEYALSKNRVAEVYPFSNILTTRLRLVQLIEACHLLDVRTNKRKPGLLPNQQKTRPSKKIK